MKMRRRFVHVRGVNLHLTEMGAGDTVLFLHGFLGAGSDFLSVMEKLAGHFHCVAVDLLGHGQSDAPPEPARYTMSETMLDLVEVMPLLNTRFAHVVGYSMGGRVALALACTYPDRVRSLVLESASPGLEWEEERLKRLAEDEQKAERLEKWGVARFVAEWEKLPLFASQQNLGDGLLRKQQATRLAGSVSGLAASLRGLGTGKQPSFWGGLEQVQIPTLLITGGKDPKFCEISRRIAKKMPCANRIVVRGAGHNTHLEKVDFFSRSLYVFFNK